MGDLSSFGTKISAENGPRSEVLFRHHLHESSEWHRNLGRFMDLPHDSSAKISTRHQIQVPPFLVGVGSLPLKMVGWFGGGLVS